MVNRTWTPRIVLVAALLATGVACKDTPPAQPAAASADGNTTGVPRSDPQRVIAPGLVEPLGGEVDVAADEPGRLATLEAREGATVEKGALLATLESSSQEAAVALAHAQLAEAEAALVRARRGVTRHELEQARQERDAAAARAHISAEEAARSDRLKAKNAIPEAEWDRARSQSTADAATAAALAARHANLAAGTRREDIAAAEARASAARAQLAQAEAALARRRILAPIAGTVLWSRFEPGEYYTPGGQALFVLGVTTAYQVRVDVDEIDVGRVRLGAAAAVRTDAGGAPVALGKVVWVSPRMGRKNITTEAPTSRGDLRIREVVIEVPASGDLLPGLRVWAEISAAGAS